MNILLFRQQINNLIGDLVGEYTLPSLATTPAIRVREGDEQLDENTSVSGLEVIIETSEPNPSETLYGGIPQWSVYHVRLVQWSGYNYDEAMIRLLGSYRNSYRIPITVPPGMGPTRQGLVVIQSSTPSYGLSGIPAP